METIRISALRGTGGGAGEISLVGPSTVLQGSVNNYTITDFDSFSEYSVSSSIGTATQDEENITLSIPAGAVGEVVVLSVTRGASTRVFQLALGGVGVATPVIASPQDGATNVPTSPTLQASAFTTVPVGVGVQTSSEWEVARDSGFTDIVDSATVSSGNMTRYSATTLPRNTTLYARVRYVSNIGTSAWSTPVGFTTTTMQINKPVVSIVGTDFNVAENPTFTGSAFSATPAGSDSHVASTWVLRRADDESVVYQINNSTSNRLSFTVPLGVLEESTAYTVEVQYIGGFGTSVFSDKLTFMTANTFVPDVPGTPFGGGYYAGRFITGGQEYALVVAPKALGGEYNGTLAWKTSQTITPNTDSINDGLANTLAMIAAGASVHPAANFCNNLTINGHNDWYLPSKDELEILYRVFRPATQANDTGSGANASSVPPRGNYTAGDPSQTDVAEFRSGGVEAFGFYYFWSSTQVSSDACQGQYFRTGQQVPGFKSATFGVRGVRRVAI